DAAATGQYTLHDLWKLAKDIGLASRAGKSLSKNTLNDLLHRRTYTGVFKYGADDWQQGTYQPLISTELYTQAQVAMGWVRSIKRASTAKRNYPYKGVLVCDECGFNITAYSKDKVLASGMTESYVFYVCTHKSKVKQCKQPQLARHAIETEIKARATEFETTEEESSKCLEYINEFYVERLKQRNQYLSIWKQDHKEATDRIVALDEALETRTISPERYKARVAEHEATQVRTKELIDKSSQDAERWLELATEVFTGVVNIGTSFEHGNDDERRQLMLMLGLNWTLGNKKVALTARKPLDLLYNSSEISSENSWRARPDSNRRSPP
ncbi:MAG: site-specific recombinase, partial [Patescibacteria group bacterium]|nr:site-specific recombinase [Patescibacteria group bacterium]